MQNKYKAVLITGAAGFIGSTLVKKFLINGYSVFGIDNLNSYYDIKLKEERLRDIDDFSMKNKGKWKFFKASIDDKVSMESIFKKISPDVVVNLAAQAGVRYSIENPSSYVQSNLVGFSVILELSNIFNVKHIVYASSSSVYGGNNDFPFSENQKVNNPLSFYASTKISNEMMANAYSYIFKIPITGLRFFTVYGPWGRPDMAPMIFAKNIFSKKPISIYNHGKMSRDFTFISDIVEATYLCCLKPPNIIKNTGDSSSSNLHKIFNVGNGQPVNLLRFIDLIENALSIKAIKSFEEIQPGDVEKTFSDTTLLNSWINYQPKIGIEEGVNIFVKWFLNYYV